MALPTSSACPWRVSPDLRQPGYRIAWLVPAAVVAIFVGLLYGPLLNGLWGLWQTDANYSHGPLVPLVAVFLAVRAHQRRGRSGTPRAGSTNRTILGGTLLLLTGLMAHLVAWFFEHVLLDVLSLIIVLEAALLLLGGPAAAKRYAFAVVFLVFMAPLPMLVHDSLARHLQQFVSATSAFCFDALGLTVFRQGYHIHLPGYTMEVGLACSGMRQILAIVAVAAVLGYLEDHNAMGRLILGLLVVPVAVAANCVRVVLTGLIGLGLGTQWAEGLYHTLEGLAVVLIAGVFLVTGSRILKSLLRGATHHQQSDTAQPAGDREQPAADGPRLRFALITPLLACFGVVLAAQVCLQRHLAHVMAAPPVQLHVPLEDLPLEIGPWIGQDLAAAEPLSHADAQLQRRYAHIGRRQLVTVWCVYSQDGEDRFHHPEVCMASAGVPEIPELRRQLRIGDQAEPIQQFTFGRGADFQRICYWHYTLRSPAASELSPIQQLYRTLRFRHSSLTVQVFVPGRSRENEVHAREFVKLLDQALQQQVGLDARRGHERLPIKLVDSR